MATPTAATAKAANKSADHQHKGIELKAQNGSGLRIAIVHARWNATIVDALVDGSKKALLASNVTASDIHIHQVPGAYELPMAARALIANGDGRGNKYDAVICIGVLIKGSTMHFEYICEAVSQGITRVGLDTGRPVIFGVLTCLTEQQALDRAGLSSNGHNHGTDWGLAAVEMSKYRFIPSKL